MVPVPFRCRRLFPKSVLCFYLQQCTVCSTLPLNISPQYQKYHKSERLGLNFWDPHRLAAHVLATVSQEDKRDEAVEFIMENRITGTFLVHYTYDIEG
jgi:hypothetical protein